MTLKEWLRSQHADLRGFFERGVLRGLAPEHWTARPGDTGNSIAWLVWHLARVEDVVINGLVRGEPQVLASGDWERRMGVPDQRVGTGFEPTEVAELGRAADVTAVDGYWQAVRQATATWLAALPDAALDTVPDIRARAAALPPIAPAKAQEILLTFWGRRPVAFLVGFPLINHGYLHIGEMQAVRGRLGIKGF
jgi:DinB superfamily